MTGTALRIATRNSQLALWQANFIAGRLRSLEPNLTVELVHVATTGDRTVETPANRLGGVGIFTREVQHALLDGRADVAVHSLKDLPTEPVEGVSLAAVPERASPFDALVLPCGRPAARGIADLPAGAQIGTGSRRRRVQLLHQRSDLRFIEVRGNVDTRLRKLDEGLCDALILAQAGLERLGLESRISARLGAPELLPAAGQGALGIECRSGDDVVRTLVNRLNHPPTWAAVAAERQVLAQLRAGCHAPVGTLTSTDAERLLLEAVVLSRDGTQRLQAQAAGTLAEAIELGAQAARNLLAQGAGPLIADAKWDS